MFITCLALCFNDQGLDLSVSEHWPFIFCAQLAGWPVILILVLLWHVHNRRIWKMLLNELLDSSKKWIQLCGSIQIYRSLQSHWCTNLSREQSTKTKVFFINLFFPEIDTGQQKMSGILIYLAMLDITIDLYLPAAPALRSFLSFHWSSCLDCRWAASRMFWKGWR